MYNSKTLYIFKGNFGSSVRFSECIEYFHEHPDSCFNELVKLKTKTVYSFTLSWRKGKIKETKQKD